MAICDSCKRLAATPKRPAVPAHLAPVETAAVADPQRAPYRCVSCQSQWRWVGASRWVLMLPPEPTKRAAVSANTAWWSALGQWFAGARFSRRRIPLDFRPPRLAAGTPGRRPVVPIVPPPAVHPDPAPRPNDERP